jgi:hypothetical protein
MKDHRVQIFQKAVDGLIESLEAVIRLSRWSEGEPKPEPLVLAASKLLERLGTADRLSSANFQGPPADVAKVTVLRAAMSRLDAAYLTYRQQTEAARAGSNTAAIAASDLESEIASLTANASN